MCLALPAKVIEKNENDQTGVVDLHGNRYPVNLVLVPEAELGSWVLIHAGYAIRVIDPEQARETWELLDQIIAPTDAEGAT